jgi:hypothetical protein
MVAIEQVPCHLGKKQQGLDSMFANNMPGDEV